MAVPLPASQTFTVYSNQKYTDIIYQYGLAHESSTRSAAYYQDAYRNNQNYLTYNTIQNVFQTLRTTGSFARQLREVGPTNDVAIENVVLQMVTENPRISICATAQEVCISHIRVWRIINPEDLYPYKLTSTPEQLPGDVEHHMFFCNWFAQAQIM